ncbi:MAG: response regulator, partial [Candidatus Krumholzibacteria bacterium]|nr:response regulator [Candidatus Krumholzibacteria bacterium]
ELMELELAEDSPFLDYVEQIKNAGDRAAGLVNQLLAFSRKQVLVTRVIDLNELLTKVEKMLAPVLGEDILLECRLSDGPLAVLADSGQLEQVVINLVTNARDSMPQVGTLVLETSLVHLEQSSLQEGMRLSPGPHAVLAVTDTGSGMSSQVLTNIFDPFFTTKEQGKGTGLGLSTVYGIVKQSGGDIVVESELGQGSVFRVYLPIASEAVEAQDSDELRRPAGTRQASETVLLVEDDEAVSGLVERILRREGYRVHVASYGVEAMALVAAEGLRPDLLLTDVVMPEMGGPELARHLAPAMPDMKILFASGYTDDALVHRGALADGVDLIQKPFAPRDLLKRLRDIFSAR